MSGLESRSAVLDLDGTLLPGVLGVQYLTDLIADGNCDPVNATACLRAIDRYIASTSPRDQVMAEAYHYYAAALRGISQTAAHTTARKTWQTCRRRLFPFAEEMIALLLRNGFRIYLISGNADLPVQEAVCDLGLTWGRGTTTKLHDGRFTSELTATPGLTGGKDAIMHELRSRAGIDRSTAIAIGNAVPDTEIFRYVDHPIAFEPDAELRSLATQHDWAIANRDTILRTCARVIETISTR